MAKRPPRNMQIAEFEKRLDKSDELTEKLLLALHGDKKLNVEGLIPLVNRLSSGLGDAVTEVSSLKEWKRLIEENRGVIQIKRSVLVQRALAIVGAIGLIVSAAIGVTQLIDWMYKQGIITPSEPIGTILSFFFLS